MPQVQIGEVVVKERIMGNGDYSEPVVKRLLNGFEFLWYSGDEWVICASVTKIYEHSRGAIDAEIEINHELKEIPILSGIRVNLTSQQSRNTLTKRLLSNPDVESFPWARMIDDICAATIILSRKGEPVIELTTIGDVKPPEYVLYPLIVKNYPNIIFGDPSASKSTLAVILAQVVMLPWSDNPMGLTAPNHSIKVLYLDWETDADTIQWQTTMLQRGIQGAEILFLNYRQCSQPLAQDVEQIKKHITDTKAGMIIIDSLGLAAGGELKETQSALGFYSALRSLKTTSLILAHNSKERESKTRSIYGNQFFTVQARNVWELRKDQDADSDELAIALFHRKPPPFSKMHKPLGFKIVYDNEAGKMSIEHSDPKTVGEFLAQMSATERIYNLLKDGALNNKEIQEELEMPEAHVRVALKRLKDKRKVEKFGDKWGLLLTA